MNFIKQAISHLVVGEDLDSELMASVMNQIMNGEATDAQIGAFLIALRMNGETTEEIVAAARVMREKALKIPVSLSDDEVLVDTCGTGGDGLATFNISTAVSFVVAGAGIKVAKHGNRSISSRSGSADCLEALGIRLTLSPERCAQAIEEIGIGFLFAPALHPAMKYAIGPRREIGVRSLFNLLGPLCNPASANVQLMGVFSYEFLSPLADVLGILGAKNAWVIYGPDGMDELGLSGINKIASWESGKVREFDLDPGDYGFKRYGIEEIRGEDAKHNASIILDIFSGQTGACRDTVILNAGVAIYLAEKVDSLEDGFKMAAEVIDSGKALDKLNAIKEFSMAGK